MDIILYPESFGPLQTARRFLYIFMTLDVFFVKPVFHFQLLVNLHGYIILYIIVVVVVVIIIAIIIIRLGAEIAQSVYLRVE
jgi:hypothetical protein